MAVIDFVVNFDPAKDNKEDLFERIMYSVFVRRLKANKPAVVFIGGDSGEGKSYSGLRFQEIFLRVQNLAIKKYLEDINVFTPLEYPKKLEKLLFDKKLKKVNIICIHEAREVIKAKRWQSFLTQAIADINAMSRTIKRLCIIIISQFIRDITNDMRYTLSHYCIVRRPRGQLARLYIWVLWKDDRDLQKPMLRKRKLAGYLKYPNGKYRKFIPQYFELRRPEKAVRDVFDEADKKSKSMIIRRKMEKLINEMEADVGIGSQKVEAMVEYYTKNQESIAAIGKRSGDKWKMNKTFTEIHDMTRTEKTEFEERMTMKLKKMGLLEAKKKKKAVEV